MPGINIPGVTDKYNTNSTVDKLMQIERIPLTREQKTLETYKNEQDAWREVNKKMTSLRESAKTLYSFDNPFNNKVTDSTQEFAITATANRGAEYESFKVDVLQTAMADRFLTSELDADTKVPQGTYTYKIQDKSVTMRWKGGSLSEFSSALNRRGNGLISSRVIGASKGKKTLLIEGLKTGEESKLVFEDDAKTFAETSGMIIRVKPKTTSFLTSRNEVRNIQNKGDAALSEQEGIPELSEKNIRVKEETVSVPPRGAFSVNIPESALKKAGARISFTIQAEPVEDITIELNKRSLKPDIPEAGSASFRDITIFNSPFDTQLPETPDLPAEPLEEILTKSVLFAIQKNGKEVEIPLSKLFDQDNPKIEIDLKASDYENLTGLAIRNRNTGYQLNLSSMEAYSPDENLGFVPQHPVTQAQDAVIKYEGITIKRSTNDIDDIVPEVTLNLHDKTEKTATISIKPDTESAKDALINFVGKYNQAISEVNILTQNKQELIDELDYLSDSEREKYQGKLGMFVSDSSLTSLKSSLQSSTQARYPYSDEAVITMLSQAGIATNASNYSGYTPSKLRGYLEIDEKKLDEALEKNLNDIKNLFGYDSDGDLIVDSGIAYLMDKQLTAYVQTGGILPLKSAGLDSKIKQSEQRITRLEGQMEEKEAELRAKYGQMEGTLNSLENQQSTIQNFANRGNGNR